MALRRRPEEPAQPRILEVDASMAGSLTFKDPVNLQINGRFEGSLETKGNLFIGERAQIKATITGEAIIVRGSVEGPIIASQRLELHSGSSVIGTIITPILVVQEGAVLHGQCEMRGERVGTESRWMPLDELARYLEVDTSTVAEWAKSGRLPGEQDGQGQWRFNRQRVETWLAQEKIK